MVLDVEVEGAWLADVAQHDRVLFAAVGDVRERDVGELEEHRLEALLDAGKLGLALLDGVAQRAHGGDRLLGVAARLLDDGDLVARLLALGAHALDVGEDAPPLLFEAEEIVEDRRGAGAPALERPADLVGVRAHHLHFDVY